MFNKSINGSDKMGDNGNATILGIFLLLFVAVCLFMIFDSVGQVSSSHEFNTVDVTVEGAGETLDFYIYERQDIQVTVTGPAGNNIGGFCMDYNEYTTMEPPYIFKMPMNNYQLDGAVIEIIIIDTGLTETYTWGD